MARKNNKDGGEKPVTPPANYKDKVQENIGLTKVLIDIVELYVGSATHTIQNGNSKKPDNKEKNT